MKDAVKVTGELFITARIGNRVIWTRHEKNKVTTLGLTLLALLVSGSGTRPSHMGIGTGFAAAVAGDTALGSESARVALASTTPSTNTLQWAATFPAGTGTGTMRELGLFNAGSGGTMSNRAVPTTPMVKTASMSIDVVWQLTFSN